MDGPVIVSCDYPLGHINQVTLLPDVVVYNQIYYNNKGPTGPTFSFLKKVTPGEARGYDWW